MKLNKLIGMGFIACSLILSSCGGGSKAEPAANTNNTDSAPPNADQSKETKFSIDTEKSTVNWRGYILGMKEHTGTLKFKSGEVKVSGDQVLGGGLVVDMTTMSTTDDNYTEESPAEGLIAHLSSPDFFDVSSFSTATLVFTGGESANLTVRDKTDKETLKEVTVSMENGKKVLKGKMNFNRQKYGVAFAGPAKDVIISDEVELDVTLYEM